MMLRVGALEQRRTVVAIAAVAGLELAWLYALLYVLCRGLKFTFSVPPLLLIYAVSFILALGLRTAISSTRVATLVSWLAWPFATLLLLMFLLYPGTGSTDGSFSAVVLQGLRGIPQDIGAAMFIVPAACFLWWFGARLATSRVAYETVLVEFQCGLLVLAASLFVGYLIGVAQPHAIPIAVAFVGLGLVGAAGTRTDDERTPLFFRRGRTWWGMLLISVCLVLMVGVIAAILFTPESMRLVGRGIHAVWDLIDRLLQAVAGLFSSSGSEMSPPPPATDMLPMQGDDQGFTLGLPEWLRRPSRIIYGIVVGTLALAALWRIGSQLFDWMRRRARADGVKIESLPGAFRLDLARLLRRVLAWIRRLLTAGRLHPSPRQEPAQTTSVRGLYADMLRWGARSGFPRAASQTPLEYQQALCLALPAYQTDVSSITESYVRARYGAQAPTDAELRRLKESRRRLKRRARRRPATGR